MKKPLHSTAAVNANGLSTRERQVMLLVAKGLTNKAVADQLGISEGTIKLHLHKVYRKLGVSSRFELTVLVSKLPS